MRLILTIVAFNLMIIIHELGHFLVAKLLKVSVKEFSLFIGPKIFSRKFGETIYSLRTIPIVAYVKLEGEEESSESDNSFNKKPVWARALIILAGPLANIVTAIIAIALVFMLTGVDATLIAKVDKPSPAYEAGLRPGDRVVEYDGKSTYTRMDFLTYYYVNKGEPSNIKIERNTEVVDLSLVPIKNYKRYIIGVTFDTTKGTVISTVSKDSPAEKAGFVANDRIVKVENAEIKNDIDKLRGIVNDSKGKPMKMEVERPGKGLVTLTVEAQLEPKGVDFYSGLYFDTENLPFGATLKHSVLFAYSNIKNVGYTLKWLFTKDVGVKDMMGPIGIVDSMNQVAQSSVSLKETLINLMQIFAFISVAIGATNLIPFPALDGSKLVLLGIEAIRRKPIPVEKEAAISLVGLSILMGFAVFITYFDITRIINRVFSQP